MVGHRDVVSTNIGQITPCGLVQLCSEAVALTRFERRAEFLCEDLTGGRPTRDPTVAASGRHPREVPEDSRQQTVAAVVTVGVRRRVERKPLRRKNRLHKGICEIEHVFEAAVADQVLGVLANPALLFTVAGIAVVAASAGG